MSPSLLGPTKYILFCLTDSAYYLWYFLELKLSFQYFFSIHFHTSYWCHMFQRKWFKRQDSNIFFFFKQTGNLRALMVCKTCRLFEKAVQCVYNGRKILTKIWRKQYFVRTALHAATSKHLKFWTFMSGEVTAGQL